MAISACDRPALPRPAAKAAPGFTLLELLIVISIIALASAVASLALRDPDATRLAREGQRLATLLEAGRAQSRALGLPVRWSPITDPRERATALASPGSDLALDFRFEGAPKAAELPTRWLGSPSAEPLRVEMPSRQPSLALGPEPMIGAQRLVLHLGEQRLVLATDGLGPFVVVDE